MHVAVEDNHSASSCLIAIAGNAQTVFICVSFFLKIPLNINKWDYIIGTNVVQEVQHPALIYGVILLNFSSGIFVTNFPVVCY